MEDVLENTKSTKANKVGSGKVLLTEFKDQKFALFAKRCAREATGTVNMCPEDHLFCWPTFKEEMKRLNDEGRAGAFLNSLAELKGDPDARDCLLRFVSPTIQSRHLILAHSQ